jgi:hypothetical protein
MALFFNHNGRFWPFLGVLILKKAEINQFLVKIAEKIL